MQNFPTALVRRFFVLGLCASAAVAQTPTPDPNAQIPGTNLFRCATPSTPPPGGVDNPADCSFSFTNPTTAYAPANGDVIGIPVVVHNIQSSSGQGFLSDIQIQSQITVLNEDFRALAGTPGAAGVDTKIQFFLATVDPVGNPTNGIRRYTNNSWFQDSGSYWNSIAWPTNRYLNIYTNNVGGGGVLGYVPSLPQTGTVLNTNADRVVILYTAFGRPSAMAPYNQGRTCVHEVGHYLGLFHTFEGGCGSASCASSGDRICDTNPEANPRYGCPSSATSCGSPDPFTNYMDYTNDACMTNFTEQQARRMRCTLESFRPLLGQPIAEAVSYGAGCYSSRGSFQQTFTAGAFDLAGTASTPNVIAFAPTFNGYTVQPGPGAWFTPSAPDLQLGDETIVTLNLPFSFGYPGGSTTVVRMCSNGFVYLDGSSISTDPNPNLVLLANGPARFAPLWANLNPALGGTCHFDVDPSGSAVYLTWADVPFAGGGAGSSCQLVLRADRSVEYRYLAVPNQPSTCLVGYTRGGTTFVGTTDISAAMPFEVGLDLNPLGWSAVGRPVLGTTQVMTLSNVYNPTSSIGLTVIGWTPIVFGLNLSVIGADDCFLWANANVLEPYLVSGTTHQWSLPIPSTTTLVGAQVFTQGALLTSGVNAFGLLTANAVQLKIGAL